MTLPHDRRSRDAAGKREVFVAQAGRGNRRLTMGEKGSSKMPQRNERTPLLQRVPVDESGRVQYPHTNVRDTAMRMAVSVGR